VDPRTIQLVILAAAFWLPVLALVSLYFFRKLQLQQRLLEIERGASPTIAREAGPARTRRAGIVCIAAGLGVCIGDAIIVAATRDPQAWALQALGVVPIAVGIGLLVDYRLARRDLDSPSPGREAAR
jgi:uncharacterized protein DUF6249